MKPLAIVVAMTENRCIGRNNQLPWHLPEDLKHFRSVTLGHAVIMGRRTHESIGRPLPRRRNIVLSRAGAKFEGVETASSLEQAVDLARAGGDPCPRVIGGTAVFAEALPRCTTLLLTEVPGLVEGDAFFPPFDRKGWRECERRAAADDSCTFVELRRQGPGTSSHV